MLCLVHADADFNFLTPPHDPNKKTALITGITGQDGSYPYWISVDSYKD